MMTIADKLDALKLASFYIGYADPRDAYRKGYLSWSEVTQYPFDGGMPVAVLCSIAQGDDDRDGVASTRDRSNFRRLLADYPGALLRHSYSNVDSLALFVHSASDELIDTVVGLSVYYSVYDESDLSELESEEVDAAFDAYLWVDTQDELSEPARDLAALFTQDEIRDAFYDEMWHSQVYPEHNGRDVLWRNVPVAELLETALFTLGGTIVRAPQTDALI